MHGSFAMKFLWNNLLTSPESCYIHHFKCTIRLQLQRGMMIVKSVRLIFFMRRIVVSCFPALIAVCFFHTINAQNRKPVFDSVYIDEFPATWTVRVYTASKTNHFYLFNSSWKDRISFHPQTKLATGLGFSFHDLAIDLGLDTYTNSINSDQKTSGFNFIGSIYSNQHLMDVLFQINNGFTETATVEGKTTNITRNDIHVFNFGITYNYMFNFRKYSFNSSFIGTQIQKKSAGSPMIGFFFSNFLMTASDSIIPAEFSPLFDPNTLASQANVFSGGGTVGYAYTLVLPYHFFLTASLNAGITLSLGEAQRDTLNVLSNIQTVTPKFISRDAVGYSGTKFYELS
jgi:hypothetical protein